VRFVTFDEAVNCAEQLGKRLPDEVEYEFAATNGGKNRFPWGDDFERILSWPFGPVGMPEYDRTIVEPTVAGLYSNVAEWTTSWHVPYPVQVVHQLQVVQQSPDLKLEFLKHRIVRGGPSCVINGDADPQGRDRDQIWDARDRTGIARDQALAGLGFRCARSFTPRFRKDTNK
jgi:formylglycine-generating enzyme required for sulfatase activity